MHISSKYLVTLWKWGPLGPHFLSSGDQKSGIVKFGKYPDVTAG